MVIKTSLPYGAQKQVEPYLLPVQALALPMDLDRGEIYQPTRQDGQSCAALTSFEMLSRRSQQVV